MIDYRDLPNETRRSVRAAIENGSVLRDADAFDGLDPREEQSVRCEGTTYALYWDTMHARAEYGVDDVRPVNASSVDPGATVIDYSNLSASGQRLFDRARNGSRPRTYATEEFPREYFEYGYVAYRGRLYRITVGHADVPQWELRVEEADVPSERSEPVGSDDPLASDVPADPRTTRDTLFGLPAELSGDGRRPGAV